MPEEERREVMVEGVKIPLESREFIERFKETTDKLKKVLERNFERFAEFGKEKILKYWAPPIFVYRSKKHPEIIVSLTDVDKTKRYEERAFKEAGGIIGDFIKGWESKISRFIAETVGESPEDTENEMWIIRSIFVERPDKLVDIGARWGEKWSEAVVEKAKEVEKIVKKLRGG